MSGCNSERFEQMLYAWELELLTDEERAEFEEHLLGCDHCYEKARKFRDTATLLLHDPLVKDTAQQLADTPDSAEPETVPQAEKEPPVKKVRWTIIRTSLVAAAILIYLIFWPWKLEFDPAEDVIAAQNRLAVMYFDDLAVADDTQRVGEMFTTLLITDLSESVSLEVVSSQRIRDLLRRLGHDEAKAVDEVTATEVARMAGARWMLTGSIMEDETEMVVTGQLVELSSGTAAASQRVSGPASESVFKIVDRFTHEVKADLVGLDVARELADYDVADVTTHSQDAYRWYLVGVEAKEKLMLWDAYVALTNALKIDSAFAMAYYYLYDVVPVEERGGLIEKAQEYSAKASRKEQMLIKARVVYNRADFDKAIHILSDLVKRYPDEKVAYYWLGRTYERLGKKPQAHTYFRRALDIDPLYRMAVIQLAYSYAGNNQPDEALDLLDRYIEAVPNEANPHDSRAEILAMYGKYDEAIQSFKKAIEARADFNPSIRSLAQMYIHRGKYQEANDAVAGFTTQAADLFAPYQQYFEGVNYLFQGRFEEALKVIEPEIECVNQAWADRMLGWYDKRMVGMKAHWERGEYDQAIVMFDDLLADRRWQRAVIRISLHGMYIQLLVEAGKMDRALVTADHWFDLLNDSTLIKTAHPMNSITNHDLFRYLVRGNLAFGRNDIDSAIFYFDQAVSVSGGRYPRFRLAQALMAKGWYEKAAPVFNESLYRYTRSRLYWDIWDARNHYYVALAYEKIDRIDKAVYEYETFLDLMRFADPGMVEVDSARQRLAALQQVQ